MSHPIEPTAPYCPECGAPCVNGECCACGASCTLPPAEHRNAALRARRDAMRAQLDAMDAALEQSNGNGARSRLTVGVGQPPLRPMDALTRALVESYLRPPEPARSRSIALAAWFAERPGARRAGFRHLPECK